QPTAEKTAVTAPANADLKITQLTMTGNARQPAISPDGKYVAYVQRDGNDTSLWIRQTTTASNVQIVRPDKGVLLCCPTVTPDGSFVDYVKYVLPGQRVLPELWRVPFLGGTPKKLIDGVYSPVGWSPDDKRMAFVRVEVAANSSSMMLVIAD